MNWTQIYKLLKIALIACVTMFAFEIIFEIPVITTSISNYIANLNTMWLVWASIWFIMFIQVCFIPIPAYIVINTSIHIGIIQTSNGVLKMFSDTNYWLFILITITAYMAGAVVAYLIGKKWGAKAVKWASGSEEDYDKWASIINKKGKWWYTASVVLPVFPDDLLCMVAGSVKFDFKWFFVSNLVGRSIGLITMVASLSLLKASSNGFPIALVLWGLITLLNIASLWYIKKYRLNTV